MEDAERQWFMDNAVAAMKKVDTKALGKAADVLIRDAISTATRNALLDKELVLRLKQMGVCDLNVVATIAFSIEESLMEKYLDDNATRKRELDSMAMSLAATNAVGGIRLAAREAIRTGFSELLAAELGRGLREKAIAFAAKSEEAVFEIVGGGKGLDA